MRNLQEMLEEAKSLKKAHLAVAQAAEGKVLESVEAARKEGLIEPLLVGEEEAIRMAAEEAGIDLKGYILIPSSEEEAACKTIELIKSGEADFPMKGHLATAALLKEVLKKENGLTTGRSLSQVAAFQHPNLDRIFLMTDAGLNIAPDFSQKVDIVQNAVNLARSLGIEEPIAAMICAIETVNPAMPATVEAAALAKLAERGGIKGGKVEGPLALDNAISVEAARRKGIESPLAGCADILVVPDIEAGNVLYKSLVFFCGAVPASIVVGARVPVVLTSRSDSPATKLYSIALSLLACRKAG